MHRQGQIVDRSKSGGLTVGQYWVKLFALNEDNYEAGRHVMDDQDLTAAMLLAFPGRRSSQVFRDVVKVRNRYNRGRQHGQGGVPPSQKSYRYVRLGGGDMVVRCTARGRPLAEPKAVGT